MRKKNGFTLVELLAVIVILIVIIVIAVTRIRKSVDKTSDKALLANAASLVKAVNNAASNVNIFEETPLKNGLLMSNQLDAYDVKISGTKPDVGYVQMQNYEVTSGCFTYGKYSIQYTNKEFGDPYKGRCDVEIKFEYAYTGHVETLKVPIDGTYKLEVWGAQGGGKDSNPDVYDIGAGGNGGYTTGTVNLKSTDTLYIYVGGVGKSVQGGLAEGGFNGGGCAWGTETSTKEPGAGGGGATDIRVNQDSLYARIIVAGGGGGGGEDSGDTGKYGGGTSGGGNYGGTQSSSSSGGDFGQGAHTPRDGGGGGGGWYGGGTPGGSQTVPTANNTSDTDGKASGGSGYVFTSASYLVSGYLLNSTYYMSNTELKAGNESMPNHDGTGTITGNAGDGYAIITLLDY